MRQTDAVQWRESDELSFFGRKKSKDEEYKKKKKKEKKRGKSWALKNVLNWR